MKKILVLGAGGFIGSALVDSLVKEGHYVVGVDLSYPRYDRPTIANEFHLLDLRDYNSVESVVNADIDEIYQLAADMGGAGYVFTGEHDADIMANSVQINLNVLKAMVANNVRKVLYTSSACIYPEHNQLDPNNPICVEHSAYPADPDSEYGWEKLFSERLFSAYEHNYGLDVRITRLHNVFGPYGSWNNGKEKSPAAMCRKVAEAQSGDVIDIWGTGEQTRSFLYIDECIIGLAKIMESNYSKPINLGSDHKLSINELVDLVATIANKDIRKNHISGPIGVQGRVSDNTLIKNVTGWAPQNNLEYGLTETYKWIENQLTS